MPTVDISRLDAIPPLSSGNTDYCQCGCGNQAPTASRTNRQTGVKRGDALRFISGHNRRQLPDLTRYREADHGFQTPCRDWTGSFGRKGYGRIQVQGRHRNAHTVAYEVVNGGLPRGLMPDHLCRNRACIRPDHLEAVTNAENSRRGLNTKLSPESVASIRVATGTHTALAREFGVSRQTIGDIKRGRKWSASVERMIAVSDEETAPC